MTPPMSSACCYVMNNYYLSDAIDHFLYKFNFGETKALFVGNIEFSTNDSSRVLTSRATGLEVEGRADIIEESLVLFIVTFYELVKLGKAGHDGSTKASAQVGRASA